MPMSELKRILVTGASGQIAYNLLFRIAAGEIYGPNQKVALHLFDIEPMQDALKGVVMELDDCAFPLLADIKWGSDENTVFKDVDLALLVGAKPRGPGQERGDLLLENGAIFAKQGKALNEVASKEVKVLVVGNPCNTNAWIAMNSAPSLKKSQFFAMTRLDENRARAQLAQKAGVGVDQVKGMIIWGNHSATQVPDFNHVTISGKPLAEVITDKAWLEGEFIETVQKRGAAVIAARGKSSAASAANALIDMARDLTRPTPAGQYYSAALCSNGNPYGIGEDLMFSFPCQTLGNGEVQIVPNLAWNGFVKEKIAITEDELVKEKQTVMSTQT